MISEASLVRAVDEGVITAEQVERLKAIEASAPAHSADPLAEPHDDERLRFVTGFGDIFVTIGLALFLGALGYFSGSAAGTIGASAAIAVASWFLAEIFTRRQRMALPSIVLLLTFTAGVFGFVLTVGESLMGNRPDVDFTPLLTHPNASRAVPVLAAVVVTIVAVVTHYRRFGVPITIAAGAMTMVVGVLFGVFAVAPAFTTNWFDALILVCGLAIFAWALRWDLSDPRRISRRADVAFWLHFVSAPLIVHPLVGRFLWRGALWQNAGFGVSAAVTVLAVFAGLSALAVLVDRRAMLVSGLLYAGIACATLFRELHLAGRTIPATLLVLGAFVLLLSAGWRPLRARVLHLLPDALARRLPNPI